jgi:hypothetical protein
MNRDRYLDGYTAIVRRYEQGKIYRYDAMNLLTIFKNHYLTSKSVMGDSFGAGMIDAYLDAFGC